MWNIFRTDIQKLVDMFINRVIGKLLIKEGDKNLLKWVVH